MTIATLWMPPVFASRSGVVIYQLSAAELEPYGHDTPTTFPKLWAAPTLDVRVDKVGVPPCRLKIAKVDQRYRCVEINALSDGRFVDANSLRRLHIPELVSDAVEAATYTAFEISDDKSVAWSREIRNTFVGTLSAEPEDAEWIRPGDVLRVPVAFVRMSNAEYYERHLRRLIQKTYGHQRARLPVVSDEEFVRAWNELWAQDQPIQATLAVRYFMTEGAVRNRAARLRKKGYELPTRRGRNAT